MFGSHVTHIKCGQVRDWNFEQSEWFNTCTVVENTSDYPYYTNNKGVRNDNIHSSQMENCVYLCKKLPCELWSEVNAISHYYFFL
jgi:hypothetical protein